MSINYDSTLAFKYIYITCINKKQISQFSTISDYYHLNLSIIIMIMPVYQCHLFPDKYLGLQ